MIVSMIAAATENLVIGKDGKMPWHLPNDLRYFRRITLRHHVIMGRKTYAAFGNGQPLPKRTNIVITRQKGLQLKGCQVVHSIQQGLAIAEQNGETEAFIIGGEQIYRLGLPLCHRIYLTEIKTTLMGDAFFPNFDKAQWTKIQEEAHAKDAKHAYDYVFTIWERKK